MNKALKDYIEGQVLPCYTDYDPAHGISHVRQVIDNCLQIAGEYDGVDEDMIYTAAAYHDIGMRYGRDDHEISSGRWLMEDGMLRSFFSSEQIEVMKEAVEDHRASRKERPRSIYGCILAEADRDLDPERIVRRCIDYERAHHPLDETEERLKRIKSHIEEKYGPDGYLRIWLATKKNQQGLATLRRWLDEGMIEKLCLEYMDENQSQ